MVYRRKLLFLSVLTGVLTLAYAAALLFSPDRLSSRGSLHAWLDPGRRDQVGRIELRNRDGESLALIRDNRLWYVEDPAFSTTNPDVPGYPAKTARVEEFLRLLSTRSSYPLRGNAPSSYGRLGLDEAAASRVVLRSGPGLPLLDLLVGSRDATGRELYLRENSSKELRSGEDKFSAYLTGNRTAWYNLRLLADRNGETQDPQLVQRLIVSAPAALVEPETPDAPGPLVFVRSANGWSLEGTAPDSLDTSRVDSYVRGILEAEGDDFLAGPDRGEQDFNDGRISLEMGDGRNYVIRVGPPVLSGAPSETGDAGGGGPGRRGAVISGSPYTYVLAEWTVNRIFRERSYFLKEGP
ncbi:MAG: DUF4340 domain-containing protein [Treponema sp.]|jgi:hypothetical protein|nr:DUF4340 domain-containing protein [Treponema sp.]